MLLFQKILVAVDFSEHARTAFELACSLAQEGNPQLIVLHVVQEMHVVEQVPTAAAAGAGRSDDRAGQATHEAIQGHLRAEYVSDCPVEVSYRVADGAPAEEILRTAQENLCDLIVLGNHGRSGMSRMLAGSVAEAVMRKAGCPVLTVRLPSA